MNVIRSTTRNPAFCLWSAAALATVAALAYVLIAWKVLAVGELQLEHDAGAIVYVAAGCYLLGGLLILLRRRWLWIIGAVINALVMLFFFRMYQTRPSVIFSAGGLITKGAQLLLEVTLIYLIVSGWLRPRSPSAR